MRGTGREAADSPLYEAALARLAGRLPLPPHPDTQGLPAGTHIRAAMVSDVSATNGLCFFNMIFQLGDPTRKARAPSPRSGVFLALRCHAHPCACPPLVWTAAAAAGRCSS